MEVAFGPFGYPTGLATQPSKRCTSVSMSLASEGASRNHPGEKSKAGIMPTWSPKVRKIMAILAIVDGFGPLFYILGGPGIFVIVPTINRIKDDVA